MDVDPGYSYEEKFRGRVQWYMMNSNDFTSNINFISKNEKKNELVSINGHKIFFRLSNEKV